MRSRNSPRSRNHDGSLVLTRFSSGSPGAVGAAWAAVSADCCATGACGEATMVDCAAGGDAADGVVDGAGCCAEATSGTINVNASAFAYADTSRDGRVTDAPSTNG